MRDVVIVDAVRSPIGRHNGSLSSVRSDDLLAQVLENLLQRVGLDPSLVDVFMGIIEQGQLLAVGSVAEISAGVQTRSTARVRVLRDAERLRSWLAARDDIFDLQIEGELAVFNHTGDRESEARLLREVIEAGFLVVEFGAQHKSLEDVFLHVTEGRVQ